MSSMLVQARHVVTGDGAIHSPGWVEVDGNRITGVGGGTPSPQAVATARRVVRVDDGMVAPGFINAHTHLFQTFLRGVRDDLGHSDWNTHVIGANVGRFTEEDFYLAALLGSVENLMAGFTTVVENHYVHTSPKNTDRVAEALLESGIRAWLARGTMDDHAVVAAASGVAAAAANTETPDEAMFELERIAGAWHGAADGRLQVAGAVQAAWGSTSVLLERLSSFTDAHGLHLHAHCAETSTTDRRARQVHGCSEVEALSRAGFVRPGTQLVHGVHLDAAGVDLVARSGSGLVHCPVSNAYLASGVAPLGELRRAGVPVALAADGSASNHRQDPFETMKATMLLQRVIDADPLALLPDDVLDMMWRGGANVLDMVGRIGVLAVGAKADLIVMDLDSPHLQPMHDLRSALVLCATAGDVRHVVVDGRIVVEDRRPTTVDLGALIARCRARLIELEITGAPRAVAPRAVVT